MNLPFTPNDWYWAATDGRIFSSAREIVVDDTDQDYIDWVASGGRAYLWARDETNAETEAALQEYVLSQYGKYISLAYLKAGLSAGIDVEAERQRMLHLTAGTGQAMEYMEVAGEAKALLAAMSADPQHVPDPDDYPFLSATMGIDGSTLADVAATVNAAHDQWRTIGSAIRAARLMAKAAIGAATDYAAARAVQPAWPMA